MFQKICGSDTPLLKVILVNLVLFYSIHVNADWQATPADKIMLGAKIYKQKHHELIVKEHPGVLDDKPYNPQALLTSKCRDYKGKVDLSKQICHLNQKSFFFIVKTVRDLKYGFRYVFVEPFKNSDTQSQNQLIAHLRSK